MREGQEEGRAEAAKEQVAANKDRIAGLISAAPERLRKSSPQPLLRYSKHSTNASVPYGKDDSDSPEGSQVGEPAQFDFEPKHTGILA